VPVLLPGRERGSEKAHGPEGGGGRGGGAPGAGPVLWGTGHRGGEKLGLPAPDREQHAQAARRAGAPSPQPGRPAPGAGGLCQWDLWRHRPDGAGGAEPGPEQDSGPLPGKRSPGCPNPGPDRGAGHWGSEGIRPHHPH